jgi:hypothetical protein
MGPSETKKKGGMKLNKYSLNFEKKEFIHQIIHVTSCKLYTYANILIMIIHNNQQTMCRY